MITPNTAPASQPFDLEQQLLQQQKFLEGLSAQFDQRFQQMQTSLDKIDKFEHRLALMSENFDRLQRTVNAIESFPVPYGRPKTFHGATEYQSVSGAVRKNVGY